MLSQKYRLRGIVLGLAVSVLCVQGAPRHAVAASYTFSIDAGGGVLSGSFTGIDGDADNIIEVLETTGDSNNDVFELTALSVSWDGAVSPTAFAISLSPPQFSQPGSANTVQFAYDITANTITNLFVAIGGAKVDCNPCGPGDSMILRGPSPDLDIRVAITAQNVNPSVISAVPEPQTAILFSLGLAGMVLYTVYRHRYAVVTTARSISIS